MTDLTTHEFLRWMGLLAFSSRIAQFWVASRPLVQSTSDLPTGVRRWYVLGVLVLAYEA